MASQFIIKVDYFFYSKRQTLPVWFHDLYYNGQNWLYLINNKRLKFKVWMDWLPCEQWQLYSDEWRMFIEKIGYEDIIYLHFIKESADTFYVTGYNGEGVESGGYRNFNSELGSSRWLGFIANDAMESPLIPGEFIKAVQRDVFTLKVNREDREVMVCCPLYPGLKTKYCSIFHGPGWMDLAVRYHLLPGVKVVFTNRVKNRVQMIIFKEDGQALTNEVVRCTVLASEQPKHVIDKDPWMEQICKWSGHGKYHMDEDKTFYRPMHCYVFEQNRQTIPEGFVKTHKPFNYEHAFIRHKPHQYRIVLYRQKHHEDLSRDSHVYFKGPWWQLAKDLGLKQNQMLRFKYIKNVVDEQAIVFYGENPVMIPMFHLC